MCLKSVKLINSKVKQRIVSRFSKTKNINSECLSHLWTVYYANWGLVWIYHYKHSQKICIYFHCVFCSIFIFLLYFLCLKHKNEPKDKALDLNLNYHIFSFLVFYHLYLSWVQHSNIKTTTYLWFLSLTFFF